jgi:hypothetical protein
MRTKMWFASLAVATAVGFATSSMATGQEPRTIQLSVTEKGFEPARVKVVKGQPLKLVVTRRTDDTCAREIEIHDANVRADLPLNTPVTLAFTPTADGELKYACGMNMVTGVLEVASRDGADQGGTTARTDSTGGMMGGQGGMGGMMGEEGGMMGGGMQDMRAIHGLLSQHQKIERSVKDIPDGVETVTTSRDPEVAKLIREHVWQMKARIEEGRPIRQMDPLFREVFKNHQHIHMQIADVPGGVRVSETADKPDVVPLVRQHARRAVSEFVAEGMRRAMQPTPLPPGYTPHDGSDHGEARPSHGCHCMGASS